MTRKPRVKIVSVSQHAIHWCNNRQVIFAGDTKAYDFFYLNDCWRGSSPAGQRLKERITGRLVRWLKEVNLV